MSIDIYDCALTTKDNPYDPLDDFQHWWSYDKRKGYNTCEYLARIARTSHNQSDLEKAIAIEQAIDEIIAIDPFDIYMKVKRLQSESSDTEPIDTVKDNCSNTVLIRGFIDPKTTPLPNY